MQGGPRASPGPQTQGCCGLMGVKGAGTSAVAPRCDTCGRPGEPAWFPMAAKVGLCPSVVFLPVLYRFLAAFLYVHRRPVPRIPAVITELPGMGTTGKPSWFLTAANAEMVAHKPRHLTHPC